MKKQYKKCWDWRVTDLGDWHYELRYGGYHRSVRTFPELRRNYGDRTDFRDGTLKHRLSRNFSALDAWNDFNISKNYGQSWKTYTKHKKQWMVRDDPEPKTKKSHSRLFNGIMAALREVAEAEGIEVEESEDIDPEIAVLELRKKIESKQCVIDDSDPSDD